MAGPPKEKASMEKIASVVSAYFMVSISLVFVNKWLMSGDGTTIPAPLFVTWFQCVVTVVICWALGRAGRDAPAGSFYAQFPEVAFDTAIAKKVLPLSVIFVGMMTFNNLCLKYVEVSFYNVARSLTICFNVLLTRLVLGGETSRQTLYCLAVVVLGFFVGTESEVNFSFIGTLFGVTSSLFVSMNSIWTRRVADVVDNNQWRLSAYNNINAVILFLPFMLMTGEIGIISEHSALLTSFTFWAMMLLSGVFGFLIGICTIMQIQVTSPLTHNISGTAKAAVQTVLAFLIWQNPTSFMNIMGIALVLGGSLLYSYVRTMEMRRQDAAKAAAAKSSPAVHGRAGDDREVDIELTEQEEEEQPLKAGAA
uniref:Sugar phosphate transporter domain-containing protein n=1 Tax=Bicosoecida sp. CB-2014 TaxID=1486930 RepID=A0A7S1G8B8_9STRA|eukprot:CAMPEP_0203832246 /NCGR_PEP_ID=MMETSP0115-20131106/70317_1 /ASSEMBLY_ACC=CAM_ASM_000227 /TAXON_ID=33651 /ORGANISM="Bicosoecid sp, Strain ms1" /LENGTH=365 /DNA_ID=CAMNT_0050741313 /DNA_START=108 /DNA_END=1205 /DNA_ORIENTATION=+